jgi:hypothetical protein
MPIVNISIKGAVVNPQRPAEANSTEGQGSRRAVAPSDDDDDDDDDDDVNSHTYFLIGINKVKSSEPSYICLMFPIRAAKEWSK